MALLPLLGVYPSSSPLNSRSCELFPHLISPARAGPRLLYLKIPPEPGHSFLHRDAPGACCLNFQNASLTLGGGQESSLGGE